MRSAKNKPLSLIAGLIVAFALSASIAHAQAPAGAGADLQKLVAELQNQIRVLQEQIFELKNKVQSQEKELTAVKLELQFTKNIQRGASGEEVKRLQEFLRSVPDVYPEGVVSGYFGTLTEIAVKKFQEKRGIEAIGVVGPKTRAVLNEVVSENCSSNTARPCFDRRAGDKIFILNAGAGDNAFAACLNNPSENKTGELLEKTSLCDEEKIQFCYEGQSANLIRKFDGACQVKPTPLPTPTPPPLVPSPEPIAVPPPPPPTPTPTPTPPPPSPTPTPLPVSQPSITVLSPNGGEKILQGSMFIIQWSTANLASKSVNIALYQYKDGTWTYWNTIATNVPQGAETGTFTYAWKTLNFDIDRDFYIEVSGAGAYPSPMDKSDQPFHFISNYSVQVVSPNGGESWLAGSSQQVRWRATRLQSFPTTINLLKGEVMYRTLLSVVFPDYFDGTALVKKLTIPVDVPASSDYTIEVVVPAIWSTIPEARDTSDKPFSIASSTVVAPAPTPPPSSPATVSLPTAPTDLKITNGYAPAVEPPQMFAQLFFKYTLQPDSKYINVYYKKPTDAGFTKYTHDAWLVANISIRIGTTASSDSTNKVGDSYMSYTPTAPTWTWFLLSQKLSADWPVGIYKYYLTSTNTSGIESAPSPELTFSIISPPTITYPAEGQTVSTPFTITVTDTTLSGQGCANSPHLQMYRANSTSFLWEKTFCASQTYDGPTLTTDGNPHRIVFYGSALGGVYSSQIVIRYFNVSQNGTATTTASAASPELLSQNLAALSAIVNTLSSIIDNLKELLR